MNAIIDECVEGSGIFIRDGHSGARIYRVEYGGDTFFPLIGRGHNKRRQDGFKVITFLSANMADRAGRKPKRRRFNDKRKGPIR